MKITTSGGTSYTPPADTKVEYSNQIQLTQLPIPTLQLPYLLNFGGAEPQIVISFKTTTQADIATLLNYFQDATSTISYTVDLSVEWGKTFTGFAYSLSITQEPGQGNVWSVRITIYIGVPITG